MMGGEGGGLERISREGGGMGVRGIMVLLVKQVHLQKEGGAVVC